MKKYEIYVNGKNQGQVKTADATAFLEQTYPGVEASVNEEEREIYLSIGILDAMKFSHRNDRQ